MSYAIRNTLILLVALIVIYGGGYAYMNYFQIAEIERLEVNLSELESELNEKSQIAEYVPALREQYAESKEFIDGYDKTIFRNNNPDEIFRFLSILNEMAGLEFNFSFRDSTVTDDYGIVRSEITGSGPYRGFMTFINAIENSEPVQKIYDLSLTPFGQVGGFQDVNFTFHVESNYDSNNLFESARTPGISTMTLASAHNPFFPLIRTVEPNEDNLPNVDESRLTGVSSSMIFLVTQENRMVTLRLNDRVYLGRLESINASEGTATFRLNRGGIIDVVTLEVQR